MCNRYSFYNVQKKKKTNENGESIRLITVVDVSNGVYNILYMERTTISYGTK